MEREKLAWMSCCVVSVAFFLYIQMSSSRRSSSTRRGHSRRTSSLAVQHGKNRSPYVAGAVVSQKERSRSHVSSRHEKTIGLTATNNNISHSKLRDPSPHPQERYNGSEHGSPGHAHWLTRFGALGFTSGRSTRRPSTASLSQLKEVPKKREFGTQTSMASVERSGRADATEQTPGTDVIRAISPIKRVDKDSFSPVSQDAVLFAGGSVLFKCREQTLPFLPPLLEHGVVQELTELITAVQFPHNDPKSWLELYNFLTEIPRTVLVCTLRTKKLPEVSPPFSLLPSQERNSSVYLNRLQHEVCCLLRGDRPRYLKYGQFDFNELESAIVWRPFAAGDSRNSSFFLHCASNSSDDDNDGANGEKSVDDFTCQVKLAEDVERLLLRRRQSKMPSSSVQFPENSSLSNGSMLHKNCSTPSRAADVVHPTFEESEVAEVLRKLSKLRSQESFSLMQRNGTNYNFYLSLLSLSTMAEAMLERSAGKKKQLTRAKLAAHSSTTSSQCITPSLDSRSKQDPHKPLESVNLNVCDGALKSEQQTLSEELNILLDKASSESFSDVRDDYVISKKLFDSGRNRDRRVKNKEEDRFARVPTTSTVPSPMVNKAEHKSSALERLNTHSHMETSGDRSSLSDLNGSRHKISVYDRLYTPLKNVQKAAPPTSPWKKERFNLYA
uniref:WGS project CAEQ00000000 data, annotated contig 258 n=1 Tax=Trypanosoma congolense (strain IL3000) TaxID=1068625 RepID=F9WEF2_TRYCI|nr:unnamed protein product [Trypanosoma congolense IL3000]